MTVGLRLSAVIVTIALIGSSAAFAQGAKPAPKTAKPPVKAAPAPKKPATATAAVVPAPPPPAPPSDVRFKSTYTNNDQVTDSATFLQANRERYELGDTILIKQHDQKRIVQISRASNTYLISAEDAAAPAAAVDTPSATPPGEVQVAVSIVDLGDRKTLFGQEARHVRTLIDRQPQAGACDQSKMLIDTDGWYIDLPKVMTMPAATPAPAAKSGCADNIKTTDTGDPKLLGFPINYKTTYTEAGSKDAKPMSVAMEVSEFEVLKLDASLFEVPSGMTEATTAEQLSKAISDANEAKLAQGTDGAVMREKKPGTLRVGVPEVANKTSQTIDTRALRARLVAELEEQKIDVIPMAAAPQPALDARAKELGVDYLLVAEVSDLKVSKPGGITKIMKNTAGEGGKDITEAKLNVQLVAPGSKPRLSKTSSGKDGGIGLRTGLGLAKFAGSLYLKMYMGGMYGSPLSALGAVKMMNLGGMGNPALMQLQSGLGATRTGGPGVDRTAGAAMFIMQRAMTGSAGGSPNGPSFDAALDEAIQDAGKDVVDSMKKAIAVKK